MNDQLHQIKFQAQVNRNDLNLDKFEWDLLARFAVAVVPASLPWSS
jgi:hypothetical protein